MNIIEDLDLVNTRGWVYICNLCPDENRYVGEKYATMGHIWKKHVPLDESPFFCDLCHFRCQKQRQLESHVRGYTPHRQKAVGKEDDLTCLKKSIHPRTLREGVEYKILRKNEANQYWKEKAGREQPHSLPISLPIETNMLMSPATPSPATPASLNSTDSVGVPDKDARCWTLLEAIAPELTSAPEYFPTPILTPVESETALNDISPQNNDQEYVPALPILTLNTAPATTITSAPPHTPPTQKRHRDEINVPEESEFTPDYEDEQPPVKKQRKEEPHLDNLVAAITMLVDGLKQKTDQDDNKNLRVELRGLTSAVKELNGKITEIELRVEAHTQALLKVTEVMGQQMGGGRRHKEEPRREEPRREEPRREEPRREEPRREEKRSRPEHRERHSRR